MSQTDTILRIEDLRTHFFTDEGVVKAVDGVNYELREGETLAVVGESGCGKSVTAMSILRLIPEPPGKIVGGRILFEGKDLTRVSEREMRRIRGNDISMIFQEPMTSLNPVFTVGNQIIEAIVLHQKVSFSEARRRAIEMLEKVGIPDAGTRIDEYPHQLSGGMKQRVMIAMALSCNPKLLIADEPTTALDVTIQAQILDLLRGLQKDFGMSILLITHDLGVVAEMADQVAVMYASKVVETAPVVELFGNPKHPYTDGLFRSLPDISHQKDVLEVIPGVVPSPLEFPPGCKFNNRCDRVEDVCHESEPTLISVASDHACACHIVEQGLKEGAAS